MTLVDTSIWVDHLRKGNSALQELLHAGEVFVHPFVIGELACGTLRNREEILTLLQQLPAARVADHAEVLDFVETQRLWGHGVGWIDVHLLASALLSHAKFWTFDKRLHALASNLLP